MALGVKQPRKKKMEPGRDEVEACVKEIWKEVVFSKTGFEDMNAMREAWSKERTTS